MNDDTRARTPLGAAVKARREGQHLTRADVQAAGGPSAAALARIENGETDPATIKPATKTGLEDALRLPRGWIDAYTTGAPLPEAPTVTVASESDGEQVLVGIMQGVARLSAAERRAVLALVRALQDGR